MKSTERYGSIPIGARVLPQGATHFRVWAPRRRTVEIVIEGVGEREPERQILGSVIELSREGDGYFSGVVPSVGDGVLYRYRLDGESGPFPDPASRYQPAGPHGPSQVVDPNKFKWTDHEWRGPGR